MQTIARRTLPVCRRRWQAALGIRAVVRERRTVFLVGQARVHLDRVEGLGEFVDLEVVLRAGQDGRDALALAQQFMAWLCIFPDQLIKKAYIDLPP